MNTRQRSTVALSALLVAGLILVVYLVFLQPGGSGDLEGIDAGGPPDQPPVERTDVGPPDRERDRDRARDGNGRDRERANGRGADRAPSGGGTDPAVATTPPPPVAAVPGQAIEPHVPTGDQYSDSVSLLRARLAPQP